MVIMEKQMAIKSTKINNKINTAEMNDIDEKIAYLQELKNTIEAYNSIQDIAVTTRFTASSIAWIDELIVKEKAETGVKKILRCHMIREVIDECARGIYIKND